MSSGGKRPVLSWVTEHWGLKLVSLLLAIGFWFYASGEETIEVVRSVPLHMETGKKELIISEKTVSSVAVRLRAPRALLSVLSSADVSGFHRVVGVTQAGEYSFRVTGEDIKVPSNEIQVTGIFPEVVTVSIDEMIVKKLPVEPHLAGDPAYGYKILKERLEVDPNAILVEGPKAQVSKVESVKTEPIELVGRTRSFRKLVRLALGGNMRPTSETIIDVYIPISEEYNEQAFSGIPVKPLGIPGKGLYPVLEAGTVSFSLKGPVSQLERLSQGDLFAYVDVTGLEKGSRSVPAHLILPETVSLKDDPPQVRVEIKEIR